MNAQTEQLIYWKQQADYYRDREAEANEQLDDIMEITDELERQLEKAVEALREVEWTCEFYFDPDDPDENYLMQYTFCPYCKGYHNEGHEEHCEIEAILAAIDEPTDA